MSTEPTRNKPRPSLTCSEKAEVLRLHKAGMKQVAIAQLFHVSAPTIHRTITAHLRALRDAALAARQVS